MRAGSAGLHGQGNFQDLGGPIYQKLIIGPGMLQLLPNVVEDKSLQQLLPI